MDGRKRPWSRPDFAVRVRDRLQTDEKAGEFGEHDAGGVIMKAIEKVLESGPKTQDTGGSVGRLLLLLRYMIILRHM
jgi:hypothetical protein